MKKLLTFIVSIFLIIGCTEKENMQPEGDWDLSNPSLMVPSEGETIDLIQEFPDETIDFEWTAAVNSAGYDVTYQIVVLPDTATSSENPLLKVLSDDNGKALTGSISYQSIDQILSAQCIPASSEVSIKVGVVASSMERKTEDLININVVRFQTETLPTQLFLTGSATEAGVERADAIPFKRLLNADGSASNVYEVYSKLSADGSFYMVDNASDEASIFGINEANLIEKCGNEITVDEEKVYRLKVDLENGTYELRDFTEIELFGAPPSDSGDWTGLAFTYKGKGIYTVVGDFKQTGGYLFRKTDTWENIFKHVNGSSNTLILEEDKDAQGVEVSDMNFDGEIGEYTITIDLSSTAYTYTLDKTYVPPTGPESLFYIPSEGDVVEMIKEGNRFKLPVHVALQTSSTFKLNSSADGSGTYYSINGAIGQTDDASWDNVTGEVELQEGEADFTVALDQAYMLTVDFDDSNIQWQFYNVKLFHWSDWDAREEIVMTYQHPFTYVLQGASLKAGFDSKFISPWDIEFGAYNADGSTDDATAMSGTTTNKPKVDTGDGVEVENFKFITVDGTYNVELVVNADLVHGTYSVTQ
ncbi:hypothetical protein MY04_2702 [Flammeovirga sp. MY04]|uniref:hypothetical protein n=1 Tax=Flammeovirga sp. MY04 TaxID=1191459 RepID=UPI000806182C|nr:hypothetical protein [Flammeovirga sp. MY04]ANQ50071.1 hypothetical protein MY04_2702 [Flammeovirga sp. MY04]